MGDIVFVTAYKDLQREKWSNYKVPREHYIQQFLKLGKVIEYDLEVYVEAHVLDILQDHLFPSHVSFHEWDKVDTFYHTYLKQEMAISKDPGFINSLPSALQISPKIHPDYTLINHSKINFIADTKKRRPDFLYYGWIDFGYYLMSKIHLPSKIDVDQLDDEKIAAHSMKDIPPLLTIYDLLHHPHKYITGGSYIVPSQLVEKIEEEYEKKLKEYYILGIMDDDQSIMTQLCLDHPSWFRLYIIKEFHGLFKKIKKISNIKE